MPRFGAGAPAELNIVCPSCQARYRFDERKLGDRPRARTRCAKCGGAIEIVNPALDEPPAPPPMDAGDAPATAPPAPKPPPPPLEQPTGEQRKTASVPRVADQTNPGSMTGKDIQEMLELPKDKRFSLAVIQGEATGQIHPVSHVRTTIGRVGADVNLDDPEASRQHAVVEILGDHAVLRDVGSTNGTFVDGNRIEQEILTNHMEFRIGSHVLMFIVTSVE